MSCRFSNHGEFLPEQFDSVACSACFYFIFMLVEPYSSKYRINLCPNFSGILVCPNETPESECNCETRAHVYNLEEFALIKNWTTPLNELVLNPPLPYQFDYVTRDCCAAARNCCRNKLMTKSTDSRQKCPPTWDGWNCFDWSTVGPATAPCPSYIYGGHYRLDDRTTVQECTEYGWKDHDGRGKEHTNYSQCPISLSKDPEVRLIAGVITYSISVVVVLPAVMLLACLRPIRSQPMFILHRHLLISFLAYGALNLLNVSLFVVADAPLFSFIYSNHIFCRLLFSIQLRFLRLSNFSWMLAEGVYLFRLLYSARHSEDETLNSYKLVCWGVPAVLTAVYMMVRGITDEVGLCWIENSLVAGVEWMIIVPSLLAMMVNVLLLTLVMYILVKKLRCDPHLERIQYRKAVRGALMLIPVFGIQQLLTIYRFENTVYQAIDQSLNGLQGLFVALIVCYTNRTVIESISKYWNSRLEKRAIGAECRQRMSIQENSKVLLKPLASNANNNL
ncbi:unnamed protein product [Caenorhabditis bovis]|uniref:G-protein coupled receptors family 2 profile 2 domain-containing protein n=1 Tax=Caenorhabditis bovis TaxID=2654633 RepID=A0A8S1ER88_9PELO|nr:unnamed protein product [Caenorhabditis bovis]